MTIVEVIWLDAGCEHNDLTLEQAKEITPMKRSNVGYLIESNDEKVVVAFGMIADQDKNMETTSDTLVIPKNEVVEIKNL